MTRIRKWLRRESISVCRKTGIKIVKGIQGGIQGADGTELWNSRMPIDPEAVDITRDVYAGIGSTAEAVRKNVLHNVGEGLSHGRKGAQAHSQLFILDCDIRTRLH